ncbi:branched-chain amino acid ABC transporter permease [Bosea sp. (in: a-proteobacteria)]|uniref:branched-chain amino acid ABC transporter permease n=1 Tax=Bosea sp. (in: a-proteobacteria) TaxID=1871050 RepID=UPI002622BB20|nr:branched-chain amino acid ABC transporter permease [Bosea sp. (in: a-proteobacteria)]MCO5092834.1 branched-chain amino acid ABC transporter permease [Bosea sp. (in: a-proteobacteria)]
MRALLLPLLAAVTLALAGCGGDFDTDQTRLCRQAIPPLNPPGARIAIEGTARGPAPRALRLYYRVQLGDGLSRHRSIDCLFAGEGGGQSRGALIGIASDGRPMADASFYLLRRFYLEDRVEPPPDPAAPAPETLPAIPAWLAYGLQQSLSGLPSAAIYAMLAAAYALVYGLTGRIILSFGEFAALGALSSVVGVALLVSLSVSTPFSGIVVAFVVAIAVCALHGFAMGRFVLRPLERASGQQVLIATIGLSIALSEYLRLAQGPELRWLPPVFNTPVALAHAGDFIVTLNPLALGLAAIGLGATLGLVALIRLSAYGRAWRAVADDRRTAALFGVDARAVHDAAVVIACAACGLAGVIVTVVYGGMGFAGGFSLGLKALVAAILGGIGSVGGAALGGLSIAVFEALWSAALPIDQRDLAVYALLAIVLIWRPGGFFGEGELTPRRV